MEVKNMDKEKLYENGIEEAKKSYVIFENVLFIVLIALGFLGMYPLGVNGVPIVSILYALFVLIMLVFVLRKHLCTGCYYYDKWVIVVGANSPLLCLKKILGIKNLEENLQDLHGAYLWVYR